MKTKRNLLTILALCFIFCLSIVVVSACALPVTPCQHEKAEHRDATPATCTTAGSTEYWYCGDCGKYFRDSACANQIALADTIVPAYHDNPEHHVAVAASCSAKGNIEYWYCANCGKYFSDSNCSTELTEDQVYTEIDANRHLNISPTLAIEATCIAKGNILYWHCSDCGKYFSDSKYTTEITLEQTVTEIDPNNHDYGEFEYDYTEKKYSAICSRNNEHVAEQVAGVEGYPFLVRNADELIAAIEEDGYIKVEQDIVLNSYIAIQGKNNVNIYLDNHTISTEAQYVFVVGTSSQATVTIDYGDIICTNAKGYCVYIGANADVTLINCRLESAYVGIRSIGGNLTLENTFIIANTYGYYDAVGSSAVMNGGGISAREGGGIYNYGTFEMNQIRSINAKVGVYNYGSFKMDGGHIKATSQAINSKPSAKVEVATLDISNAIISNPTDQTDGEPVTGMGIQLATTNATIHNTLISANTNSIVAFENTTLNMTNCIIKSETGFGVVGNGAVSGITMTLTNCEINAVIGVYLPQMDSEFTMTGGKIEATKTGIEIRAGKATLKGVTITSTAEEFSKAPDGSGSTIVGAAIAVSQHTTDKAIEVTIEDCTLTGYYAFYEEDLQNDTYRDLISVTFVGENNTLTGYVYSQNCDNIEDKLPPVSEDDAQNAAE